MKINLTILKGYERKGQILNHLLVAYSDIAN